MKSHHTALKVRNFSELTMNFKITPPFDGRFHAKYMKMLKKNARFALINSI